MTAMISEPTIDPARLNRVGNPDRPGMRRGRRLFKWLPGSDPHPTPGQMASIRQAMLAGDPLADAVVAMYHRLPAGEGRKRVDQALEHGIDSVEDAPAELTALFHQVDHEPIWLDREQLRLACEVSHRVGLAGELVLRNLSLMGGYLAAAAAKPLAFTGELDRMANRRLVETGKFWIDVTTPGGLERDRDGFKSAVRVRLMHAQVRAMLLKSDKWDPAWGHPLNQWDSMATILEFSVIFLSGLRSLGFLFSKREREAVVHLWRYVGYLMGVDERLLPACEADAMRALYQVIATIGESDEDSRRLGEALARASLQDSGDGWLAKRLGRLEYTLRAGYTRYVLGDDAGDKLGLPRTATKYVWPAQIPLRLGVELVRKSVPSVNRSLMRLGERARREQFPKRVQRLKADTSFTPVKKLAR
ncbi:MAG: oxygenase MpaB family protein [Alloalcanivorax venustensis]|uniref:oxygenase MpaB family protein n=1 Tax=Alloalcanivorax venustensis TaxID=172371 RepID=UPI003297446E